MSPHSIAGSVAGAPPTSWRRWLTFAGPATLVSVGYMDPGNWASDLEGGSRFGYSLLCVLALSSLIATFLQHLAAKLGLATGLDLAQACRAHYRRGIVLTLWVMCQLAIIACDLAEVIGSAVALNLLFGIPIVWGAVLTVTDVVLILLLEHGGVRRLEAIVAVLVATVAVCLGFQLWLAQPQWSAMGSGFAPALHANQLYVAVAILGATVMPHNLYLHSSLVKTRRVGARLEDRRRAIHQSLISTVVALSIAFLINAAILVIASDVFHPAGIVVDDLREAHRLLVPLLGGTAAAALFAVALLAAGQSATITGTLAGQAVMLGFLDLRNRPAAIRLVTRLAAIVPAVATIAILGEDSTVGLLIATQIALSLQLPFAVVPLVRFTGSQMGMGRLRNGQLIRGIGIAIAIFLTAVNLWLTWQALHDTAWLIPGALAALAAASLLVYLATAPLRSVPRQMQADHGAIAAT